MTNTAVRQLSPEELALVCGGTTLPTVSAVPGPEYYWPDWPDYGPPDFSDPWDYPDPYDSGGGSGGDSGDSYTISGLGEDVDRLINLCPKIEELLNNFLAKGFNISFQQLGATNGLRLTDGNIVIDIDAKDSPMLAFMTLTHELGHFEHPPEIVGYPQKDGYVNAYLTSEGYALITQLETMQQLQAAGESLNGYNFQGSQSVHDQMSAIYSQIGDGLTEAQAAYEIGQIYGNNQDPDTGQTIRENYGDVWEDDPNNPHRNP